ncbi:SpoIIIAH-like family protein [Aciduricibacillus chroicocephali]|uniref:SpoIIIAH-like family protein n=1 Tax=Aciduricibacillus chroicocephali TaxID=3054939 RepID=A0ABY9KS03_9BACI|nr:SpoIIIAH-like family protein [Bacillaceae bacterium 44XB]
MLKKQTIWLLTMLSLMVVLSAYYMMSPNSEDLAYIDNGAKKTEGTKTANGPAKGNADLSAKAGKDAEMDEIRNVGKNEFFTTIRMEVQDERSKKKDRLNEVVASGSATAEEKNRALQDIDEIDKAASKESILQETILNADKKYEDVLVRAKEDKVQVHVKVKEMSREEAVNIMQLVKDEFGEVPVDINYQPTEG